MKQIRLIFISIFFITPVLADEGYYSLSYKMNSIVASIELNGVLQTESSNEEFISGVATGLNIWIMPGKNTLKIKLLKPFKKSKNASDPKISIFIRLGRTGQSSDEGQEILSFSAPEKEGDNIIFPLEKEISFIPELIPPSELWDKASEIELDDISKKEIKNLVQDLYKAANTGNKKEFLNLNEFKISDLPKAMYAPKNENKKREEKEMTEFLKFLKGKLEKIPSELSYNLVANNKIIYITDAKGNDIIKTRSNKNDGQFKIPVYVAKIDNKWLLVR